VNRAARRALERAAQSVLPAFEQAGPFPGQEVTPPLLVDALRQCFEACQQADTAEPALPAEEINELGTHALECLSDLGLWAFQLKLDEARTCIEDLAMDMAHWIIRHGGRITELEPVVNALARQANATRDPTVLSELFERGLALIGHAEPGIADDASQRDSWRTLHVNCAIIATRTGDTERMNAAFDLLEKNLPEDCTSFYSEGLRETEKDGYGDAVRETMRERLAKWTTRH
jgi:hypothetical protein